MLYVALIGDLIESKQLKNRKQALEGPAGYDGSAKSGLSGLSGCRLSR